MGDETALPAIRRRLEEMRAGVPIITVVAVAGPEEEQDFVTATDHRAVWVHRPSARADDPTAVIAALDGLALPSGDGFVWIAEEPTVARAARTWVEASMHP